jgi:hypothetical protein
MLGSAALGRVHFAKNLNALHTCITSSKLATASCVGNLFRTMPEINKKKSLAGLGGRIYETDEV